MSLFNPKEDVIEIQLTQFGKYLLTTGRFKPEFYAFFDDDILYDSRYAQFVSESQNDVQTRIEEETIRSRLQYVFNGVETNLDKKIQSTPDRFSLQKSLGTSETDNNKAPYWNINFIRGEIVSSSYFTTGSFATASIPQLNIEIDYKLFIKEFGKNNNGDDEPVSFIPNSYLDGTYIKIVNKDVFLDVQEMNSNLSKETFLIEGFIIEKDNRNNDVFIPLKNPEKFIEVNTDTEIDGVSLNLSRFGINLEYNPQESKKFGINLEYNPQESKKFGQKNKIYNTDVTLGDIDKDCKT